MKLLTKSIENKLRKNAISQTGDADFKPVVKFFNPCGAATWLFTELLEDGDTLYGIADLGFGEVEYGYASLTELSALRVGYGLGIERDCGFTAEHTLREYMAKAKEVGRILA